MLKQMFFMTIIIFSFLGLDIPMIPSVRAAVLIDCEPNVPSGDLISRAFYIQSYPGNTLSRADLWLRPNASGTYTFSLIACANTFDGTQIGASNTTVTLSDTQNYTLVSFDFPPSPVVPGSLVTFKISKLSGSDTSITFNVNTAGGCPVVETEDATPPLSTFRRDGIAVKIYGDLPQPTSWRGDISFPIKISSMSHDNAGNIKFVKSTLPFAGSIEILTVAQDFVPDENGCYVKFSGGDGTKICIKEVATIETSSSKSKTNQLLMKGTGTIITTIEGIPYTGVVYLDATGTLKQNGSGELTSIGLKGKIGGGADLAFVFDGSFNTNLNQ